MPIGTKVHKMYEALKREGVPVRRAVKIAQAKTGLALATGKPPKGKRSRKKGKRKRKRAY